VIKKSRGVNGAGVALAETNGAIATYLSKHPMGAGIVVNTENPPWQSIASTFAKGTPVAVQYSVAIKSVGEAAKPIGPAPWGSRSELKKLRWAA
jgi:hypothetical protein